ncbi:MAG: hypothetical protein OIF35_05140, partial [Cellvibrionaceae bacterium]|nr:hypothetical protein [Cellvibrionaceae bacterium]
MKSFYMRKLAFAVGLAGIAASANANFSAGQIQAGQTPALKGDMAWGGEGDWQLSNGKVCAVVSGVEHEGELAASGGYLTDLGYCDRPGEGFGQLYFVLNLSAEDAPKFESLKAEQGEDFARIVGRGSHAGFDLKASYELNWAYGDRLQLKLELHHRHSVDEVEASALGWVNLNRGNAVFSGSLDGQGP